MKKKRKNFRMPNGAGSVYKLPGNRRNPWTAVMHLGYANDGRNIRKYIGYYPTYEEALHALEMYKETPFDLNNKDITISRLYEILLEEKAGKAERTIEGYKTAFSHLAAISNTPIRQLRKHDLKRVIKETNIKPQSKAGIRSLLSQLYKIAIDLDVLDKNYAEGLEIGEKEESTLHTPFTVLEIRKLWQEAKTAPFAEIPLLLCYTGMRPQELLNIKIVDINIEEGYLIGGMKTKAGKNRLIPIHKDISEIIRRRMAEGKEYLIEEKGRQISYARVLRRWKSLMSDLGLSHLPHDGRHTFVTIAQNKGMDKLILKRIIGHAAGDLTDKVYTHKYKEQLVSAVNDL